jgi:hypothetical protein
MKEQNKQTEEANRNIASIFKIALTRSRSSDAIPAMATGGVVYPSGRIVRLGDGNEPELVLPASKAGGVGSKEVHLHFHGNVYGLDDFAKRVKQITANATKGRQMSATGTVNFAR